VFTPILTFLSAMTTSRPSDISTPTRSKASSSNLPIPIHEATAPTVPAGPLPDLLAGLRLDARALIALGRR